jgi:hypothetical protein
MQLRFFSVVLKYLNFTTFQKYLHALILSYVQFTRNEHEPFLSIYLSTHLLTSDQ